MTAIEIIQLLIGSGTLFGILRIVFIVGKMSEKIENLEADSKEIKNQLQSISTRLSRLEGAFQERGYWESRRNGTEGKPG